MKYLKLFEHEKEDSNLDDLEDIKDIFQEYADEYFMVKTELSDEIVASYVSDLLDDIVDVLDENLYCIHKLDYDSNLKYDESIIVLAFVGFDRYDYDKVTEFRDSMTNFIQKLIKLGYDAKMNFSERMEGEKYFRIHKITILLT